MRVDKVVATRSFENAVKRLCKKHEVQVLNELSDTVNKLINFEITTQKSNHPLKDSNGHRDLHLAGGRLILLYKYDENTDTLIISLRLQDIVNHDELKSYDRRKYNAATKDFDVSKISGASTIMSIPDDFDYFSFYEWYHWLEEETQWEVDDLADKLNIPIYEEATPDELYTLMVEYNNLQTKEIKSNTRSVKSTKSINANVFGEGDSDSKWIQVAHKMVEDSDGFLTDYTMYKNVDGTKYICMFGDNELYGPDPDYADFECETEKEAYEWFEDYNGFGDYEDDAYEDEDPEDLYGHW